MRQRKEAYSSSCRCRRTKRACLPFQFLSRDAHVRTGRKSLQDHGATEEGGGECRKETYADEVYAVKSTAFANVSPGETFHLWVYDLHNKRHPFTDVSPGETFSSLGAIEYQLHNKDSPSPMSHLVRHSCPWVRFT